MSWADVAKTIGKMAPLVGTAVGGPVGTVAGGVVSALCSLFGADPEDPAALDAAIKADPEAALKLREFELQNKTELQKIALETDRAHLADRADARSREVAITQATGKKDTNLYVLAWTVIIGFFFLCGILMFVTLPAGSDKVVYLLFGGLVTGFGTVLQYFFGSSKSSSDKTALLAARGAN